MATPEEMAQTMRNNLKEKTGNTIESWLKILAKLSLAKHGQIVKHLKAEHGVTHGFANLIAHDFLNQDKPKSDSTNSSTDLIETQYSKKEALRPIYDAIIEALSDLKEVEISPKKTYVSLRRNKQFALIQPSTKTRVDVGINLKGEPATDRLEESGSFNQMVSHRVRITDISEVDQTLIDWLKMAYEKS